MRDYFVVINSNMLDSLSSFMDFSKINLSGVVIENGDKINIKLNEKQIPSYDFSKLRYLVESSTPPGEARYFLIGYQTNLSETKNIRDLMVSFGADKKSIHNFSLSVFQRHLSQVKYATLHPLPLDFFATGISYAEAALYIDEFKDMRGINLAFSGQDLWSGYEIAKLVFSKRKVKFALIELPIYAFSYDISRSFSANWQAYHYRAFLPNFDEDFPDKDLINLANDRFFAIYDNTPIAEESERCGIRHPWQNNTVSLKDYIDYESTLKTLDKPIYPKTAEKNKKILANYIDLCKANGAKPILFTLPHTTLVQKTLRKEVYEYFKSNLAEVLKDHSADFINLFYEELNDDCFFDLVHLNASGAKIISKKIYDVEK